MKQIKFRIFDTVQLTNTIPLQNLVMSKGSLGIIKGYDFENQIYSVMFEGQQLALWGASENDLELVEKLDIGKINGT